MKNKKFSSDFLIKAKENTLLILILLIFSAISIVIFMQAWNGIFTNRFHLGINFEQTSVAMNYKNFSLLRPFSENQQDALHLPPLYSWFIYLAITVTGWIEAGELVSLIFGLFTLLLIFRISREIGLSKNMSLMSTLILSTSPLFILLSSSIMQETTMIFFSTLSIFFLLRYLKTENEWYPFLSGVTIFLSTFSKWPGFFTLIPFFLCLFRRHKFQLFKKRFFYFLTLFPFILSLVWFLHIQMISISPPSHNIFNRLFFQLHVPITKVITHTFFKFSVLFPVTTVLLVPIGLASMKNLGGKTFFLLSWLSSGAIFYLIFLQGAFNHNHYGALMLPPLAIIAAYGLLSASEKISNLIPKVSKQKISTSFGIALIVLTLVGSMYVTRVMNPKCREIVKEEKKVGNYINQDFPDEKIGFYNEAIGIYFSNPLPINKVVFLSPAHPTNFLENPTIVVVPTFYEIDHATENKLTKQYAITKKFEYYSIFKKMG